MKLQVSIFVALSLLLGHGAEAAHPKVTMSEDPIENSFIVVFKDATDANANADIDASFIQAKADALIVNSPNVLVTAVFEKALHGFVAKMTTEEAEAMAESDEVAYIAQDGMAHGSDVVDTSSVGTWGLDRVDQRNLPLDYSYSPTRHGAGVTAYILDTGIRTTHVEFENRATWGANFMGDGKDYDCQGHGTHVAGTVAGKGYGVAKKANVVAVKVLGCDKRGPWSGVIQGVNWVMQNAKKPAVANMSLGGSSYQPLNDAVNNLYKSGVPVVVSAGNNNVNACSRSPASATDVITVGATTRYDDRSSFSNWGNCVDIMAPGSEIRSAWKDSNTQYADLYGTSMASPHVCGAVALLLEAGVQPADVRAHLFSKATSNVVKGLPSNQLNRLLYVDRYTPPPPPPPSCVSGETAVFTSSSSPEGRPIHSLTKVKDLRIGDTIRGFDSNLEPASCKVEAIGSFGVGEVYGNYTAGHYVFNPDFGNVEQHGMTDPPSIQDKFDLISDCPLVEDEVGKKFSPIDSDFCGGNMEEISWSDYLLLHSAILNVVRKSGGFWFRGSSYTDMSMVHKFAPRVCKNMIRCMKDNTKCRNLERASNKFINKALKKSAKLKAREVFSRIGHPCEVGSVSAVVTTGKTLDESLVGTEAC